MGWETVLMAGMDIYSASQEKKAARNQARATVEEGNIALKNKGKEVRGRAASQTVSFLNSGLTLDGTPRSVIDETYATGAEDLSQLRKNYNTQAKNQASAGRDKFISSLISTVSPAVGGIFQSKSLANPFGGAPLLGEGSWLNARAKSYGEIDLGDEMPWLGSDQMGEDILISYPTRK